MSEEKKQTSPQTQKALLYILLTGGVAVLIYMFVLTPMYEDNAKYTKDAGEIIARTDTARKEISDVTKMNANFATLSAYLEPLTNKYVVREELGSYPMERRINELSMQLNVKITSCSTPRKERTPSIKPETTKGKKPSGKSPAATSIDAVCFDRLVLDLDLEGSYFAVAELIKELEAENPFCGVRNLVISPNASTPEKHKISISLEWPVDADPPPVSAVKGRPRG